MPTLEGIVALTGLPPHRGLIVHLCFFPVASADTPAPFDGDPPTDAVTDCHLVVKQADLNTDVDQPAHNLPFSTDRPEGFYFLQVRVILFRAQRGGCTPRRNNSSSPADPSRSPTPCPAASPCRCSGRKSPWKTWGRMG